ncbi:MAG: hypothetical protein M3R69_06765 [Acidobacteriota bacterium]|nr:hypothetical protein [Acidobacteriota bacterium]
MWASHSGAEARAHAYNGQWGTGDGPYAENFSFDQLGNMTWRNGWGVANAQYNYGPQFVNNRMTVNPVTGATISYDAAGNLTNDGGQSYSYDATGQQSYASGSGGSAPAFTNDPLAAGVTEVKALHITELRTAINQVRAGVGLAAYSWTYSVTTNDWITAGPILEMRTALDQALGAPSGGYSTGLAQGQPILAIHIQELRERVKTALGSSALSQSYDGDRLRGKKSEYGATTFYVRSSVLGGQVVAELGASGNWARGYVYLGGQMLAIQNGAVNWVHQDPVTKSQRVTNSSGAVISTIDLDPWGGETNRSANSAFQPHKYTTYERDGNGGDDAMHRRYQSNWTRFSQPDPYDGSYSLTDPQSFNRYSYVQNDPVNFVDPSGLFMAEPHWNPWNDPLFWRFMFWTPDTGSYPGFDTGDPGPGTETPQNSIDPSRVDTLLKNKKCSDFLNGVLAELGKATGRGRDGVSFQDLFNAARGSIYGDPNLSSRGSASPDGILIGDSRFRITINTTTESFESAATTIMHEIIHGSPREGRNYTHFQMASAAYNVGGPMGLLTQHDFPTPGAEPNPREGVAKTELEKRTINNFNSSLFQNLLIQACDRH